eukprot:gene6259-8620_t
MPTDNDLHKAANKGSLKECMSIIDITQYDEVPITVNDLGASDRRPLHRAAGAGHDEICAYFIELGAEIDAGDKSGRTALHFAALGGHSQVVKLLLDKNANILALTQGNMNCLHGAVEAGKVDVVKILLSFVENDDAKRKELTSAKNSDGKIPWELAMDSKNKAVLQALKEGGDPNAGSGACIIS